MPIMIDDVVTPIKPSDLKKFFPEVDFTRPVNLRMTGIKEDPDNPGRMMIPNIGILPVTNAPFNGAQANIRYYKSKASRGKGESFRVVFQPGTIRIDGGNQNFDPSNTEQAELLFFLLSHKQYNVDYTLFDPIREAENMLSNEEKIIEYSTMITRKNDKAYLKEEDLRKLGLRLEIPGATVMNETTLRTSILQIIRQDPEKVGEKLIATKDTAYLEIVQEAFEYKVIHYKPKTREVFFTVAQDDWTQRKIDVASPICKIPPHQKDNPTQGLAGWLAVEDTEGHAKSIAELVEELKGVLNLQPMMKQKGGLSKLLSQIVVS